MKTKTLRTARLGLGLITALAAAIPTLTSLAVATPALAAPVLVARASQSERYPVFHVYVVSVNTSAYTITTTDDTNRRLVFPISDETSFTDVKGLLLAKGRTIDGANVLEVALDKGYFEPGTRLRFTCNTTGREFLVDQVEFLDVDKQKERDDRQAAEAEAEKKRRKKK